MESTDTEVLDAAPETSVAVLKYDAIEAGLAQLRDAGKETFDVTTKEGNKAAREFVRRCVSTRTAAGDAYTDWNRPVMDIQKQARDKRDYIIGEVEKVEAPVKAQIDAEAQRKEEERIANAKAEAARIDAHQAALKAIRELPRHGLTATVAEITETLARLQSPDFLAQRDWEEYGDQAIEAVATAAETLRAHLDNATAREQLAAMKAQQEAEAAERNRLETIKDRIRAIETAPTTCIGLGAKQIQHCIDALAQEAAADFGELQADAGAAIEAALRNLNTMLGAARDAEDLVQFRADKARREQEEAEGVARKAREEQEARDAAARAEREAEEQRQRDAAEAHLREQAAAEAATARVREQAGTLLALLTEARAHVPAGDLANRIDAAIATALGE